MAITYTLRDICRLRTHGGWVSATGTYDNCEPFQILVLERRPLSSKIGRTFEVRVWCALTSCPHWFNLDTTHSSLAAAREAARRKWMVWGWRGPGKPVASDPVFVDSKCGEILDPLPIPSWAVGPLHVDANPKWLDVKVGDNVTALLERKSDEDSN